jgi:hypothetical protein
MRVVTMATAHYAATRAFAHQQHHLDHYGQYYNVSSSSPLESMDWKKKRRIDPPTNQQSNVFFGDENGKMGGDFVPKKMFPGESFYSANSDWTIGLEPGGHWSVRNIHERNN